MISGCRAAWYAATEPARLRLARERREPAYRPLIEGALLCPLVTVYIPTHNRVDLLMERALPSVLAQTYRNLEIIVAAHGCTDGTVPYVLGLEICPRVRLLEVPRTRTYPPTAENHWLAGPVVPANAALAAAKGAWLARIDDDDTWTPDHIEALLRFAQRGDYEFVSAAYAVHKNPGHDYIVKHDEEDPPAGGVQTWLYRSYLRFMRYNSACWRKSWNAVNDTDLVDRFRKAGVRMGHLNEIVAYVEPRPGETTVGLEAYRRDAEGKEAHFAF